MRPDWTPLRAALAACRRDGVALPLWWRDDDTVAPTPALDQLSALAAQTGLPVHLAIIPSRAKATLPAALDPATLIPVIHGWAHTDHSGGIGKKNEFLTPRPHAFDDTQSAMERMQTLFGPALRRMFVPPWNRVSQDVVRGLPAQGYAALSTFGPRPATQAAPGLTQINTHIDPIWWKGTRDLVDPDQLITQATHHIEARRTGREDANEPFGLLTHHLMHSPAIWTFTETFLHEMLNGGATPWGMENDE